MTGGRARADARASTRRDGAARAGATARARVFLSGTTTTTTTGWCAREAARDARARENF